MKIFKKLLIFCIGAAFAAGCSDEPTDSEYDLIGDKTPAAVITSVSPSSVVAGGDTVTIVGQNFSTTPSDNVVYFYKDVYSEAFYATPTMIKAAVPPGITEDIDSANVRVSVKSSHVFSNEIYTTLYAPSVKMAMDANQNATTVTVSSAEDIFTTITSNSGGKLSTVKITGGVKTPGYGLYGTSFPTWSDVTVYLDGNVYTVSNGSRAIYRFSQTTAGQSQGFVTVLTGSNYGLTFIEVDEFGNFWTGGVLDRDSVFRVTPAKAVTAYPMNRGNISDVKFYNGKIYISVYDAANANNSKIFRADYNSTGITGSFEEYYNLGSFLPGVKINCMAFSQSGVLYLGTDGQAGIYSISTITSAPTPLYSGAFKAKINKMEWGTGNFMYVIWQNPAITAGVNQFLYKVPTREKGAPNYGRN